MKLGTNFVYNWIGFSVIYVHILKFFLQIHSFAVETHAWTPAQTWGLQTKASSHGIIDFARVAKKSCEVLFFSIIFYYLLRKTSLVMLDKTAAHSTNLVF